MQAYVPRHLTYIDGDGRGRRLPEAELGGASRCVAVLGEPGIGKSALLERFAKANGWTLRSAASFVQHPRPEDLVSPGKGVVIDGLDELLAAKEADPVNRVLRQLIASGRPPFVLSCRAADWRGAFAARDLGAEYGDAPAVMMVEPFGREGALAFLTPTLGAMRSEEVVDYLGRMGIPEFYGNPLTLRLFGEVASHGGDLPSSRADLLLRACGVMWGEADEVRRDTALASLDDDTALSAAGALSAALLLTGSEAASLVAPGPATRGIVHATALRTLPSGAHAHTVLGSRLFVAVAGAPDRFKPVHRTVAEFLAARWLARSLPDDQARARALAMLRVGGGVPASLRGLHAWLAQDARLAPDVIATDPYGVLRYGDADGLDVDRGRRLLSALRALQHVDPFFRAEDWATHSAKGLTHPELLEDVRAILVSSDTTIHLRTLLLGIVRGSSMGTALAGDVAEIASGRDGRRFSYEERRDAAMVVVALAEDDASRRDWLAALATLTDEVSTRLMLDVMRQCGFAGFDADATATAVLAYLGPLDADAPADRERDYGTPLFLVARELPASSLTSLLDELASKSPMSDATEHTVTRHELSDFATALIVRRTREGGELDPGALLRWLRLAAGHQGHTDKDRKTLAGYLRRTEGLRRAIQGLVLLEPTPDGALGRYTWRLSELSLGLLPTGEDALLLLADMAAAADRSERSCDAWLDVVGAGLADGPDKDAVIDAAKPFAAGDAALEGRLDDLLRPRPPQVWELRREADRQRREAALLQQFALARDRYAEHEDELRRGDPQWAIGPARAYLGDFPELRGEPSPEGRVERWLGPSLMAAALDGFEAALGRSDAPTLDQIGQGYGEDIGDPAVDVLLAGVARRVREGRGMDDLPADLVAAVRIALWNEPRPRGALPDEIGPTMDALLRRDAGAHERYVRLMVEPSLDRRRARLHALSNLIRHDGDREVATRLAPEWMERHPDLDVELELDLIDLLADAGRVEDLRDLCARRGASGVADDRRRRNWDAVGLMVDFERTSARLDGAPIDGDLLWAVRHRSGGRRAHGRPEIAMPAATSRWLVSKFRSTWPMQDRPPGVQTGDENPWDATDYLRELVGRLATHPQGEAELEALAVGTTDGYTASILHVLEQHRNARRDADLPPVTVDRLRDVVEARPPRSTDDLTAVVQFALGRLRAELRGSDTDVVNKYWADDGEPRLEDPCTDRLIEDLRRLMPDYGIKLIPQRDMPNDKRADIVVTIGDAGLPIECKGQWNDEIWTAAEQQLDRLYLRDWQSQDRGIYVVYWFGPNVKGVRRLRRVPGGAVTPSTPEELRERLVQGISPARRNSLMVEVLDLTR